MSADYDIVRKDELDFEVPCRRHSRVMLNAKKPCCHRCKWEDGVMIHFERTPKLVQIFTSRPLVQIQLEMPLRLELRPPPGEEVDK